MVEPVRFGIVGCGVIGNRHLAAAQQSPDVEVVAVADIDQAAVARARTEFGVAAAYSTAAELFADPIVEAVVLALPAAFRQELALQVLAAGKHLLTEKPVGMNSAQVRELIDARGNLVAACCSSRNRHLKSAKVAAEVVASGALGELRVVRGRGLVPAAGTPKSPPPPWRLSRALNGGGIMANWGCYDLDYLLGTVGWQLEPQSVYAQAWPVAAHLQPHVAPGSDAETHVTALIRCAGGAVVTLERGEYLPAVREGAWQITGTKGTLRLSMTPQPGNSVLLDICGDDGTTTETVWTGDEANADMPVGLLTDFAQAVRTNTNPLTTLENALVIQQITDAIYESAEKNTLVHIED